MGTSGFVQCVSCGGVYRPVQDDGTSYFHACPTSRLVKPAVVDPVTGKVTTPAVFAATVNPRNENIRVDPDTGKVTTIAAGVDPVPVPAPAP